MAGLLLLWWGPAAPVFAQDKRSDLAIVVNDSSLLESVSSAELQKIFKRDKLRGPGGFKFVIAAWVPEAAEQKAALQGIFQMTEEDYAQFLARANIQGKLVKPPELRSAAEVRHFIALSPGAITYLRASDVDPSVKVLKVDGKAPGEPGYPLKIK